MKVHYLLGNEQLPADHPLLAEKLRALYGGKQRPRCLCVGGGVEMYIAKVNGRHILKRMPDSGSTHAPTCDAYEPPPELSGLGQVTHAILENPDAGITELRLSYSLTKGASRSAPSLSENLSDTVTSDANKLGLRATLHYLWDRAGFCKWSPAMMGKRSWHVLRKYLMQSAAETVAKGQPFSEALYIPEPFVIEQKDNIAQRRLAHLQRITSAEKGRRRLMLLIGEVKEVAPARYGHKLVIKHLPDFPFMLADDIYKRLNKRFEQELDLWNAYADTHLVCIATFGMGSTGVASVEEMAVMCVSEHWIPFENAYEKTLLDRLTAQGRRYLKGLRYNMPGNRPLASVVLTDTASPTALYVVPPSADETYQQTLASLVQDSKLASWIWSAGESELPPFPSLKSHSQLREQLE